MTRLRLSSQVGHLSSPCPWWLLRGKHAFPFPSPLPLSTPHHKDCPKSPPSAFPRGHPITGLFVDALSIVTKHGKGQAVLGPLIQLTRFPRPAWKSRTESGEHKVNAQRGPGQVPEPLLRMAPTSPPCAQSTRHAARGWRSVPAGPLFHTFEKVSLSPTAL